MEGAVVIEQIKDSEWLELVYYSVYGGALDWLLESCMIIMWGVHCQSVYVRTIENESPYLLPSQVLSP